MNARLKPIDVYVIERPKYDNTSVRCAGVWVNANIEKLKAYYLELGRSMAEPEDDNLLAFARSQAFLAFAQCQWDRERMRSMQ